MSCLRSGRGARLGLQFASGVPLAGLAVVAVLAQATKSATHSTFTTPVGSRRARVAMRGMTASLYMMQSFARLWGRLAHGLSPWRMRARPALKHSLPRTLTRWDESWRSPADRLRSIETTLREEGTVARRGGDFDRWDLEARAGALGSVRTRLAVEEHGAGRWTVRSGGGQDHGVRLAEGRPDGVRVPALELLQRGRGEAGLGQLARSVGDPAIGVGRMHPVDGIQFPASAPAGGGLEQRGAADLVIPVGFQIRDDHLAPVIVDK